MKRKKRVALALAALLFFLLGLAAGSGDLTGDGALGGLLAEALSGAPRSAAAHGDSRPQDLSGEILTASDRGGNRGSGRLAGGDPSRRRDGAGRCSARGGAPSPGSRARPRPGGPGLFWKGGLTSRTSPRFGTRPGGGASAPPVFGAPSWPGEVLFRPAENLGEEQLAAFADFLGADLEARPSGCILTRGLPAGVSEKDWAAFLKSEGLARAAYPNFLCWPAWVPNDPQLADQWHVDTVGLKPAWDLSKGDAALVIAVCDTGIDTDHPDLAAKIIAGQNVADNPDTANVEDINGHGTGVSGMAAAVTDNGIQLAGTCPTCQIMPVKISNQASGVATLADMIDGFTWARANGAHVINCSYNGPPDPVFYQAMDDEGALCDAAGAVLVMAAGNDDMDMGADAPWDKVLWIGSTDAADARSSFSQYGDALDLVAPGDLVYLSFMGGGSGTGSGTSFSSPLVAGVLGLMYAHSGFALTPAEYRAALYATCQDLGAAGKDSTFGWGRVDAYNAVLQMSAITASASASPTGGQAPLAVAFTGSSNMDGVKILTYAWDFGDATGGAGKTPSHTYTQVGTWIATLTVTDPWGLSGTDTVQVTVGFGGVPEDMYLWRGQRVDYLFAPVGGAAPPTVTLIGGALPPGLALAANRLTGNPTTRGNWTATIRIDDGGGTVDRVVRFRVTYPGFGRFRRHRWR